MLTILATVVIKPEHLDNAKQAMRALVVATRQEPGCLRYELHQDAVLNDRFVFIECWQSREYWQTHMTGAAITAFNGQIGDAIATFDLQELQQLT